MPFTILARDSYIRLQLGGQHNRSFWNGSFILGKDIERGRTGERQMLPSITLLITSIQFESSSTRAISSAQKKRMEHVLTSEFCNAVEMKNVVLIGINFMVSKHYTVVMR